MLRSLIPRVAACLLVVGCVDEAPEAQRLAHQIQAIAGGSVDHGHTAVVGLVIQTAEGSGACTGSLIAPNLVLTAQHCVADTPDGFVRCGRYSFAPPHDPSQLFVTTETSLFRASRYYEVAEVQVPRLNADLCGNDIAVLVLAEPIPEDEATPLVPRGTGR